MQTESAKAVHQGRNVKRIREILGVKQEILAMDLGISQQAISALEQKEALDREMLEKIAAILKVPVEAIQNFDEQQAINFISSTFHDNASIINTNCTLNINPLDKWMEALEEIKKLNNEKTQLYERMLKEKNEMIQKLEKILADRK
jgi:transcriptional regulator with XRE-family HTH domain